MFDKGHSIEYIGGMSYKLASRIALAHWEREGLKIRLLGRSLFGTGEENTVGGVENKVSNVHDPVSSELAGEQVEVMPVEDNPFPEGMAVL